MRKTSYIISFFAVVLTLVLNILSARRTDWLVAKFPEILYTKTTIYYGLNLECEKIITRLPQSWGKITYKSYECRHFPLNVTDRCEDENSSFCAAWTSAGYLDQLGIGFAAIALVSILVGLSTHSRRRRIWKAVAGLVVFQALCQLIAFAIITDLWRTSRFPTFEHAHPGLAWVLSLLSWIFGVFIAFGVITTGISADLGHRWAAGRRAYEPIPQ